MVDSISYPGEFLFDVDQQKDFYNDIYSSLIKILNDAGSKNTICRFVAIKFLYFVTNE